MAINIREAKRAGATLLIGICGASGGGKSMTALRLAYGLANGNSKKIGVIDTENRRFSLYSDKLPNKEPFLIGDLIPPFSPARYIEALLEFQQVGIEVLIIDSVSHEAEGEGGINEIAENNKLGGLPNWAMAKAEHKRFVNAMLYSNMHIIACLRAREKSKPVTLYNEKKKKNETVYVSEGLQAIAEKNFLFEMTASLMVTDQGMAQTVIKCTEDLMPYLGRGTGYITEEDGRAIRAWVDGEEGSEAADGEAERARGILLLACEGGTESLRAAWEATAVNVRKALGQEFLDALKASAEAYDRQREESAAAAADEEDANSDGL